MPHDGEQPTRADAEILSHYATGCEGARLQTGPARLEEHRTLEILERFLPPPPASILDAGGGPGAYACRLARAGHRVHLLDLVPLHVRMARKASKVQRGHPLAGAQVGDVRSLPHEDSSFDAVLLMGPLYHLTERESRMAALGEARRVLRSGGVLVAAAISRFASLLDGVGRDLFEDPRFEAVVERDLREGQHRNPTDNPTLFTTAYFHHPEELAAEVMEAEFALEGVFGLEGPCWLLGDFDARWSEPKRRELMLRAARVLEREPSVAGVSAHLLAVARRR